MPHQPKHPRAPNPAQQEDTSTTRPPHDHPHTVLTWAPGCEQHPTNGLIPPVATGTGPPHPRRCPGSRHPRTPHERTPHVGTAQVCTISHVRNACPGNHVFCIWHPCARDSGYKNEASAYGMGSGGLAVDANGIGCRGVDRRGERFFVLGHF